MGKLTKKEEMQHKHRQETTAQTWGIVINLGQDILVFCIICLAIWFGGKALIAGEAWALLTISTSVIGTVTYFTLMGKHRRY